MGPGVSPPDFGALHRSTQAKVRLHTAWGPRLPQPRSGSGQAAARARRDTPASPARRAVPALFCCDSEKDAGWGRPGCFPGRVRAALRPSAGAPARSAGHRERGATRPARRGPRGRGSATLGLPPPRPAPARPRELSTSASGSSSGLRFPGAHPARPLGGWAGRGDCGRTVRGPPPSPVASAGQRARRGADLGLPFQRAARNPPGLAPSSPPRRGLCTPLVLRGHSSSLTSGEVKAQRWTGLLGSHGQLGQRGAAIAAVPLGLGFPRGLHGDRGALGTSPWARGPRLLQALQAGVGGNSAVGRCRLLTSACSTREGSLSLAGVSKILGASPVILSAIQGALGLQTLVDRF